MGQGDDLPTDEKLNRLIKGAAAGDRDAFRDLYFATAPKLFGVAMRILKDPQKSADAIQDAYMQIWQHAARYTDRKGALEAWMVSIARFRAIDIARRDRTQLDHIYDDSNDEFPGADPIADGAGGPEQMISLRNCLERIGSDQRHALLEVHFHGYTNDELAQRYNIPVGTIKSRVRRGLQNLRQCMEHES